MTRYGNRTIIIDTLKMTSKQTTISFPIRKKCSFYGTKQNDTKEDFSNATVRITPAKYIPTVKKIVTLSSSESESDSDSENVKTNKVNSKENRSNDGVKTPRRVRKTDDSEGMYPLILLAFKYFFYDLKIYMFYVCIHYFDR